jgi:putative glycosyltransferase
MKLSIVTTLYNSALFVAEFHRRATEAAVRLGVKHEIVIVDDGSSDSSLEIALGLAKRDPSLRVVELSRNFGHHKALMAGMEHATGDLIFLIDVDLEEPPELLEPFYQELMRNHWDVVYGYQEQRKGGLLDRYGGRLAWYVITKLYSVRAPVNQCTVRLMRRDFVQSLLLHKESNPVIGALWVITGYRQFGMPIKKQARKDVSYTVLMRIRALLNGITSFSTVPLKAMIVFGMSMSLFSFLFGLVVVAEKLLYNTAVGWASIMASLWFLGGVIIFCTGVLGIYISAIFIETKRRPYVIVRKVHEAQE